ncbi:MAG TPA: outer membrane beta-barrel protein [Gammaproteobacteria bacterium]|nr:outer membrane beta-barrel protein [Gammaproteobacteria bacterium]
MRFQTLCVAMAAASLSSNCFCMINAVKGFYLGAEGAFIHYIQPPGSTVTTPTSTPMLRPVVGYRFNDYVALDGGYNDVANQSDGGNNVVGPNKFRLYTFDLAVKLIKPYPSGVSLFGKIGLGYSRQYVLNVPLVGNPPLANYSNNRLQGLLGGGISYNITKNLAAQLTGSYYFRSEQIGAMEMGAIGLVYTVDKWS